MQSQRHGKSHNTLHMRRGLLQNQQCLQVIKPMIFMFIALQIPFRGLIEACHLSLCAVLRYCADQGYRASDIIFRASFKEVQALHLRLCVVLR